MESWGILAAGRSLSRFWQCIRREAGRRRGASEKLFRLWAVDWNNKGGGGSVLGCGVGAEQPPEQGR